MTFTPLRTLTLFNTQCDIHLHHLCPNFPLIHLGNSSKTQPVFKQNTDVYLDDLCLHRPFIENLVYTPVYISTTGVKINVTMLIDYGVTYRLPCS